MTPGFVLAFQKQEPGSGVQNAKVRQICGQLESGRASCPVKDEHLARSPAGVLAHSLVSLMQSVVAMPVACGPPDSQHDSRESMEGTKNSQGNCSNCSDSGTGQVDVPFFNVSLV